MTNKNKVTSLIRLYAYLLITNRFIFLKQSKKFWMNTGSIIPSWNHLRRKMIGMALDGKGDIRLLLIHGIGCGEFLFELIRYSHKNKIVIDKIIIVENNINFINRSKQILSLLNNIYATKSDIEFVNMDALETNKIFKNRKYGKADAVIGTLPYSNMLNKLEQWADLYSQITNNFVFYTYTKIIKMRSGKMATDKMIGLLKERFRDVKKSKLILLNMPPAYSVLARS